MLSFSLFSIFCEENLFEGYEHKIALVHVGMRNGEFLGVDVEVVVEENVNVDDAVVIDDCLLLRVNR